MDAEKMKLIIAVIQASDSDVLTEVLQEQNIPFTRLPSVGSFLRERNATYLVSCKESDEAAVRELLTSTCQKRIAFIATPIENAPLPMPYPTETVVGGINLFSLDLEHFEEL
ncbi:MAG TPA: cyclic-di-AMP receptor [Anaerolineaceae bacterium]|nr:cyclic-di-AMP receptor [Anaerolineaceae bacterium]NMD27437.1 hypothetical protein [Chloroflexota bacterium]HOA22046.1 cyclic-di-AMP receptor [Anaerolineaceae bacterium]HOG77688.1 cyclic-di-AMP receptor [Anaerolineaceae bacterium]